MSTWSYGEIKVRATPTLTGIYTNHVAITTTAQETGINGSNMANVSDYQIKIISLFPPVLLSPSPNSVLFDAITVTPNPEIVGMAKTGATVTVY